MTKRHTSYRTAWRGNKPRLFSERSPLWSQVRAGARIFDLGAGKTVWPEERCRVRGIEYIKFDPFWCSESENARAIALACGGEAFEAVVCSNVLNVLESREEKLNCVRAAAIGLKPDGKAYFSAHKSPVKGEVRTKPESWQCGELIGEYEQYVRTAFDEVVVDRHFKIIIAAKPKKVLPAEVNWRL